MQKTDVSLDSEEELQQNPKDMALAVFRFRARRGSGTLYALLASLPLILFILLMLKSPQYVVSVSMVVAILVFYVIASMAGLQRFHQMAVTIDRLQKKNEPERTGRKLARVLRESLVTPILPLIVLAISYAIGLSLLTLIVVLFWIAIAFYTRIQALSNKTTDTIFQRHIEDWLVVLTLPLMVVLGVFHVSQTIEYAALAPVWLAAGIKSLYEAPESLYELTSKDEFVKRPDVSKHPDERSLSELASAGVLSSSARVGILIALQGVERITFTDLLLSMKLSKSSLYKSIGILEEAGYVTMSKGFKATGRPRNFIQITPRGKAAIKEYLETMRQVTTKYQPHK